MIAQWSAIIPCVRPVRTDLGRTPMWGKAVAISALALLVSMVHADARIIEVLVLPFERICVDGGPAIPLSKVTPALREVMIAHSAAGVRIMPAQGTTDTAVKQVSVLFEAKP